MTKLSVIWRSAGMLLAVEAGSILEVLAPVSCRKMPMAPDWIRGLFMYRGALIPLLDVAKLLGALPAPDNMSNRVIVFNVAAGHVPLVWPFGLWVECVLEIDRVDFEAAGSHPGFETQDGRFLGAVAQTRWGQVQLLNPQELFTAEQAEVLTKRLAEAAA